MAGATTKGAVHASAVVVSRSSAIPWAIFAATFAVQGAIRNRSASSASEIWWIGSEGSSNSPTATGSCVSERNVRGSMKCVACSVMTTFTRRPRFCRARTISADLYAAMQPVTPMSTVFCMEPSYGSGGQRGDETACQTRRSSMTSHSTRTWALLLPRQGT